MMASGHNAAHNKRALITGVTGQDGSYLAELLLSKVDYSFKQFSYATT
jgi:hypothetical protein